MGSRSIKHFEQVQHLQNLVGETQVHPWESTESSWRDRIQTALSPQLVPTCLVFPATVDELAAVVTWANLNHWQILPCGAGSKLSWGGRVGQPGGHPETAPLPLLVISTERLNRLIEHAIGDLTVTVEAGMRFAELQSTLAKAGQFLAIDPAYPEQATIGGIVATGDSGSLRQRYNSVRDMLLGLSFVRADGQVAKAGGRVVKNVAGYDLMKLFTGSYGTLGIVTQVTFRVYPLPQVSQTVVLSGAATAIATAAQSLLRSALTPASADFLSRGVIGGLSIGQGTGLAVRFQGILPSVEEQMNRTLELGRSLGLDHSTWKQEEEANLWQQLQQRITVAHPIDVMTCKIGIRPSAAIALFQEMETLGLSTWLGQIHATSGLGRLSFAAPLPTANQVMQVRSICQAHNGFLSILQAPLALKQQIEVWGYSGNGLNLMRGIKQQFDPQNLLSPGRFVGGI